jgi:hypothetical protein
MAKIRAISRGALSISPFKLNIWTGNWISSVNEATGRV